MNNKKEKKRKKKKQFTLRKNVSANNKTKNIFSFRS